MRIIAPILLILSLASCAGVKHVTTSTRQVTDSAAHIVHDSSLQIMLLRDTVRIHDTVVTIPQKDASLDIKADDTKPLYNGRHQKQPRHYQQVKNGISIMVDIDTAGNITATVHADSLQLVIHNLTEHIRTIAASNTTSHTDSATHSHTDRMTYHEVLTKTYTLLGRYWWVLLIIIAVILVFEYLKHGTVFGRITSFLTFKNRNNGSEGSGT